MTDTTRRLVAALERLPNDEQDEAAASYLKDLRTRREYGDAEPYGSFAFLEEAELDLPPDYSETYEERLYGTEASDNA